tara:strand:+ start:453 stop:887 length:435 start_codon:yes stop_codon:yes gene_type:complete
MATVNGTAYWASITSPNTRFDPVYTVDLVVDEKTADGFRSKGYVVKDKEYGPTIVIKRKVNQANGKVRPAPRLVDKFNKAVDVMVGNGSTVKVQYKEWESNWKGKAFQGLELQAVQILDLVQYDAPDGSEFEVEEEDGEAIFGD